MENESQEHIYESVERWKLMKKVYEKIPKYEKMAVVTASPNYPLQKSSLHENVVFSVCAHMGNAAYLIFIMRNSISGLDT